MVALQEGLNPRLIEQQLLSYASPSSPRAARRVA
jgi:hypothetical protein